MAKTKPQLIDITDDEVLVVYSIDCNWCYASFSVDEGQLGYNASVDDLEDLNDRLVKHFMEQYNFRYAQDAVQVGNCCGRCLRENDDIEVIHEAQMATGGE